MSRPLQAEISLPAIAHNYLEAKKLAGGSVLAVIKANAYGHGLTQVGEYLAPMVDALAVATIEEALALRAAGVRGRLLVLEGVFDSAALQDALQTELDLVVHSDYQLAMLQKVADRQCAQQLTVWLKIDTGMGRLGFDSARALEIHRALQKLSVVRATVLMTHMACADEPANEHNALQLSRFDRAARAIATGDTLDGSVAALCSESVANSASLIALPAARRQWNRAGIMLYGVDPVLDGRMDGGTDGETPDLIRPSLRCSMTLRSALIAVRSVAAGESIGYGADFRFARDGRYGIVACGYGDGYPRHAGTGTPVAVAGRRTRLIGRVSMDMLAVDLSELCDVSVGAEVELWGPQVSVDEVAAHAGTIAYELFTGLTQRVPRDYCAASIQKEQDVAAEL